MTFSEFGLASPWKGHGISKWKLQSLRKVGQVRTAKLATASRIPAPHMHMQCCTSLMAWPIDTSNAPHDRFLFYLNEQPRKRMRGMRKKKKEEKNTAACLSLRPYMRRLGFPIPNEQTRQLRPSSKICIHRCVSVWQLIDARLFLVCHAMLSNVIRLLRITDTNSSLAKAKKVNLRGTTRRNR